MHSAWHIMPWLRTTETDICHLIARSVQVAHQRYTMSCEYTYCYHSAGTAILSQSSTTVYTQCLKQSPLFFLVSFKSSPGSEEGSNVWKIMPALDFSIESTLSQPFLVFCSVRKIVECDWFIMVDSTMSLFCDLLMTTRIELLYSTHCWISGTYCQSLTMQWRQKRYGCYGLGRTTFSDGSPRIMV